MSRILDGTRSPRPAAVPRGTGRSPATGRLPALLLAAGPALGRWPANRLLPLPRRPRARGTCLAARRGLPRWYRFPGQLLIRQLLAVEQVAILGRGIGHCDGARTGGRGATAAR